MHFLTLSEATSRSVNPISSHGTAEIRRVDANRADGRRRALEIGGGMVHPRVFEYAGYDYARYTGFAFGMGVERSAMARHQLNSIHHFYEGDLRFL